MTAVKEAIGAPKLPPNYVEIKTVPVEQEVACRAASNLELIGPNGVFTNVKKSVIDNDFFGFIIKVVLYDLEVNPSNRLDPIKKPQGCNDDGVIVLAANSINVIAVAPPEYVRNSAGRVTNVKLFFLRKDNAQSTTLGVRAKFEENVTSDTQFKPKRKAGTITFP